MALNTALIPASKALAEIDAVLDQIEPGRTGLDAAARLGLVRQARRVRDRIEALTSVLVGEADQANASLHAAGTPMRSWLAQGEVLSGKEAAAAVGQARSLVAHPALAEAAAAGRVRTGQARAIGKVLHSLTPQLDPAQQTQAEQVMVSWADRLDAEQLAGSAARVLAEVVPDRADDALETRLQREHEAAVRNRSLRFFRDGGSVRFEGSLPRVPGEKFVALINAHSEANRRTAIEVRDPAAVHTTGEQRRADALIGLLDAVDKAHPVPGVGGAKVIVKLDYQALRDGAAAAGLIGDEQAVSAGELRLLCCDAEIVPAVLGGPSEVLDVGRSARLVTAGLRTALILRDGGCAFPGCDVRPEHCEAHHLVPWWAGGFTALSNLVLLCHSHHALVEPAKHGLRDQWQLRLGADGLPEFTPPGRLDPHRQPQRHRRHQHSEAGPPRSEAEPPRSEVEPPRSEVEPPSDEVRAPNDEVRSPLRPPSHEAGQPRSELDAETGSGAEPGRPPRQGPHSESKSWAGQDVARALTPDGKQPPLRISPAASSSRSRGAPLGSASRPGMNTPATADRSA